MTRMLITLLSAASMLVAAVPAAAQDVPEPAKKAEAVPAPPAPIEMPLELFASRPLIRLKVNGQGPFAFLVDPQAPHTVIDQRLIEILKIKPRPAAAGGTDVSIELTIGADQVPAAPMVIADVSQWFPELTPPVPVRGVVSLSLWTDRLVTLDFTKFKLRVEAGALPEPNEKDVFALTEAREWLAPLRLDETSLWCRVDPLFPLGLIVPTSFLHTLPFKGKVADHAPAQTRSTQIETREAVVAAPVSLGDIEFDHPAVLFGAVGEAAIVGQDWLRRFAITYDLAHLRARLTQPEVK